MLHNDCSTFSLPEGVTSSAATSSVFSNVQIAPGKWMTTLAMALHSFLATLYVYGWGNWLKMCRVDAGTIAAQMIKMHTFRYWPVRELIRDAMRVRGDTGGFEIKPSVADGRDVPHPLPATVHAVGIDIRPKLNIYRSCLAIAEIGARWGAKPADAPVSVLENDLTKFANTLLNLARHGTWYRNKVSTSIWADLADGNVVKYAV
jgi:hypothetical protein